MAVELDAAVSAAPTANQTSITWEHTVGEGDNRILLIALASGATNPITDAVAPTVDGDPATLLEFRTRDTTSGGTAWRLGIWYYLAPSTGTVTILHSKGGETQHLLGGSISYSGVDQADPFGDSGGAADGLSSPASFTDDIAAAVGDMVVDFIVQNGQATRELVPGANQTERIDVFSMDNSAVPWLKASDEAGAATVTMSWANVDGAVNWTHYAVALNAASEAGVTISSVSDTTLTHGQSGIVITLTGASASGNTVIVSPTDDVEDALAVAQTITAEGTTEITFTADLDSFDFGTLYLFVVNADSESNETGEVISRVIGSATLSATFIDQDDQPRTDLTNIKLSIWRGGTISGAPDQQITAETTDEAGLFETEIEVGALEDGDKPFVVVEVGSPPTIWTCGLKDVTYE